MRGFEHPLTVSLLLLTVIPLGRSVCVAAASGEEAALQIKFFTEVAFGGEYGRKPVAIRKWYAPIKYKIAGNPTEKDLKTFKGVAADLHAISKCIVFQEAKPDEKHNLIIHFIPKGEFRTILKNAERGCNGFVTFWWNRKYVISRAVVLVASDIRQEVRSCVIREEVTQALGLINESDRHRDSVFHSRTDVSSFSEVDRYVIATLYREAIRAGMDAESVEKVLKAQVVYRDEAQPEEPTSSR